ncbi:MAG: nucleotidyltransferase family protein [Chloroflexi bacterium]|nr:nucleotidyltransferase family protein [Chloroflexota bacterium]
MRPSQALRVNREAIRAITARRHVQNVRVFGSVVRGEDTEDSDLDLLVDPMPETTLMDIAAIQVEVAQTLGVQVDVLTPKALPAKILNRVLREAAPV